MPDGIISQIKLFADDSLLYARISGEEDAGGPQQAPKVGEDLVNEFLLIILDGRKIGGMFNTWNSHSDLI